jgi:hypothetical protein
MKTTAVIFILLAAQTLTAEELTLNQQLIVACYKMEVGKVVKCLRNGADVNARFGRIANPNAYFSDPWTGGLAHVGYPSWTPLIALADSNEYPDPPANLGEIWKDSKRTYVLQKEIPQEQIEKRRNNAMIILNILLSHRCNLEDNDGAGATALYKAVDNKKVALATALLEFGANPNVKVGVYIDGPGDKTPLHAAYRTQELIDLLLDHGANPDAKDSKGRTPADSYVGDDDKEKYEFVKTPTGWRVYPRAQPVGKEK